MYSFILLILFLVIPDHAIYLSLIEMEVHDQMANLKVKVFTDDLQNAIRNADKGYKYESEISFVEGNALLVENYFRKHLMIGQNSQIEFKSSELVGDSYWINFQANVLDPNKFEVKADYFMEIYPTQQNIIIVQSGELKRSCRLSILEPTCSISF